MVASLKEKIARYILIPLIIGFFVIPLIMVYFFDCKFYAPKKMASFLLLFSR